MYNWSVHLAKHLGNQPVTQIKINNKKRLPVIIKMRD